MISRLSHCVFQQGTQQQILKADLVKLVKISAVLITHLHGDHIFGIPGLLSTMALTVQNKEPLVVYGPKGVHTQKQRSTYLQELPSL